MLFISFLCAIFCVLFFFKFEDIFLDIDWHVVVGVYVCTDMDV